MDVMLCFYHHPLGQFVTRAWTTSQLPSCQPLSFILWGRIEQFAGHLLFLQGTCCSVYKSKHVVCLALTERFGGILYVCVRFNFCGVKLCQILDFNDFHGFIFVSGHVLPLHKSSI